MYEGPIPLALVIGEVSMEQWDKTLVQGFTEEGNV